MKCVECILQEAKDKHRFRSMSKKGDYFRAHTNTSSCNNIIICVERMKMSVYSRMKTMNGDFINGDFINGDFINGDFIKYIYISK